MHLTTKKENKSLQFLFCCGGEDNNNKTNTVSSRESVCVVHIMLLSWYIMCGVCNEIWYTAEEREKGPQRKEGR